MADKEAVCVVRDYSAYDELVLDLISTQGCTVSLCT